MTDSTHRLLGFAFETAVPPATRAQAARVVCDTLIAAVAGSTSEAGVISESVMRALGGAEQATVMGSGSRTSAPAAAFVNAMRANAPDLDDNFYYYAHTAAGLVPAAVAMAEAEDQTVGELFDATAIGYEVASRVGLSTPVMHIDEADNICWANPNSYSNVTLGGVVAAALLARASRPVLEHAFGLAAYAAPVPSLARSASVDSWPSSKYGAFGYQASTACTAVRLAEAGLTGDTSVLDGPFGFWKMIGAPTHDPRVLVDGLGEHWWIMDTSIKLEAAGTWMRPAIRALRLAIGTEEIAARDIASIDVHTIPLRAKHMAGACPERAIDAQASYSYLVAVEAAGVPRGRWQDPDVFGDPEILRLAGAVRIHGDPEAAAELRRDLTTAPYRARGALTRVRVELTDGRTFEGTSKYGDGDPFSDDTRVDDAKIDRKYSDFAAPLLPSDAIEIMRRSRSTPSMPVREFVRAFVGTER